MTTITFYSYKGGSGRTLLLANIAYYLTVFGQKVFAMDLDLEAPGLHYKLNLAHDACLKTPRGVLDYLHTFVTTRRRPAHLNEFVVPIGLPPGADGRLHLMAAGDAMAGEYWKKLAQINWHELFYDDAAAGIALFLDLKARIAEDYKPDYLLIDSRTGITETGGVAATLLPDIVVCPILRNRESQEGARQVLRSIARTARERNAQPPHILPVLSRLAEESSAGEAAIVEEVRQFLNQDAPDLADTLSVDYLPVLHWERAIELKETLLAMGKLPEAGSPLLQDYLNLFKRLIPPVVTSTRATDARKIYISSTGPDLRAHREAVFEALRHMDGWKCIRREDLREPDRDVDAFFREQMKAGDVFVGIVGHRFGDGYERKKESFAQQEYRAAEGSHIPRLLFLAPDDFPIPANLREPEWKINSQLKFREHLLKNVVVSTGFTSPADLANDVVLQIHHWMFASSGESTKNATTRYLQSLRQETANIDIRGLRTSSGGVYQFRIDELYAAHYGPGDEGTLRKGGAHNNPMALYIVVRHPKNIHPKWKGKVWTDDDRIRSITTTPLVAEQCRNADVIYVHLCGWRPEGGRYVDPAICCSGKVATITAERPMIVFQEVQKLGAPVKRRLSGPTNSYSMKPSHKGIQSIN